MRGGGVPRQSFAQIALMLKRVARDEADGVERVEVMIARLEAGIEKVDGAAVRLDALRWALAELQHRAREIGAAHDLMMALVSHELEVRTLLAAGSSITKGED